MIDGDDDNDAVFREPGHFMISYEFYIGFLISWLRFNVKLQRILIAVSLQRRKPRKDCGGIP